MPQTIQSLSQSIAQGNSSAESLVVSTLAAIQNSTSNSVLSTLNEQALQAALASDKRRAEGTTLGPLDGIPVVVKDNMCVQGSRTTCGSKILADFVAPYTATAVERLQNAGAIVVGKANMDEFAMGSSNETSYFGPVVNPLDSRWIPGGSSGGSAVAVAEGLVPASLGSDTGGSIRQPAACTGIVGLKPTYGRVSRYGLVAYASSLDQIGPLAHNVHDAALLLQAISGQDERDNTTSTVAVPDFVAGLENGVAGKVIGIPKEYFSEGLDSSVRKVMDDALQALAAKGAELREVSLPNMRYAISSYYVIATAEASSNLSRFDGVRYTYRSPDARTLYDMYAKSRSEGFGKEVQRRILLGTYVLSSGFYDAYYVQAQKVRRLIANDFNNAFAQCDVIASPAIPGLPLQVGQGELDPMALILADLYTVSLNLAGLPGITLPCAKAHVTTSSWPVSLQLVGKHFAEAELLQVAHSVETALV